MVEYAAHEGETFTKFFPRKAASWRFYPNYPLTLLAHLLPDAKAWWKEERAQPWFEPAYHAALIDAVASNSPALPPIVVGYVNGDVELGDGWHRLAAAFISGRGYLPAIVGHMKTDSPLGIPLRTPQMMFEKLRADAHAGNCDWARFQLDVMRQKAASDEGYAQLLPQAEELAERCTHSALDGGGLGAVERVNDTFTNRKEERIPMASVVEECASARGWAACKRKLTAPEMGETAFNAKYAQQKSASLVTRAIDGKTDITPQNMGAMTRSCTRSGDKTKALRRAHVELVMLPADVASTIGTKPGPHLRMCSQVNSEGVLVPVQTPEETLELHAWFAKCQRHSTAAKCARKKSAVIG